jgi:ferritin-like metal-binding protein YciE
MNSDANAEQLRFRLLPYLEKAYIMESIALKMLEHHAEQFTNFPDVHAKLNHFAEQTEHHLAHVEQLLRSYHEQPPAISAHLPYSFLKGSPIGAFEDVLPNTVTHYLVDEYFFTHFEIAMYTMLDTIARVFEDDHATLVAEEILLDKIEMQHWLLENLPELTLRSLGQEGISVSQSAWEFAKEPTLVAG